MNKSLNIFFTVLYFYPRREMYDNDTERPKGSNPFYTVTYYIEWGTTSWSYSI